jgi:hypothetical protein
MYQVYMSFSCYLSHELAKVIKNYIFISILLYLCTKFNYSLGIKKGNFDEFINLDL